MRRVRPAQAALILFGFVSALHAQTATNFAPLEQWKQAVIQSDAAALKKFYSTDPAVRITSGKDQLSADQEVAFWTALKASRVTLDILLTSSPESNARQIVFQAEIESHAAAQPDILYVAEGQLWLQTGSEWRLATVQRSVVAQLQQPLGEKKDVYNDKGDAHQEISEALQKAAKEHKRVLLVFGANWCYDCHVLDLAFHRLDVQPILTANFVVVHVDIGEGNKNQDLMKLYEVPMAKGIPGLAVLDPTGKLLYSQKNGEWESARSLKPADLLQFLEKWKPLGR